LIVDDSPFNIKAIQRILKGVEGIAFYTALNGKESIELVKKHHDFIDIVFMDINMPILDGIQATK
jgi:CheY-like chemotaxis protein